MAWQQDRVKDIVKKLRKNPVYAAVGDELKQAMISQEVVNVMNAVCDVGAPSAQKISDLYFAVCKTLLWGENENQNR